MNKRTKQIVHKNFLEAFNAAMEVLGIRQAWRMEEYQVHDNSGDSTCAAVSVDFDQNSFILHLNVAQIEPEKIAQTALHEATHLLLYPLYQMARNRSWDNRMYEAQEHVVVNSIVNAMGHDVVHIKEMDENALGKTRKKGK